MNHSLRYWLMLLAFFFGWFHMARGQDSLLIRNSDCDSSQVVCEQRGHLWQAGGWKTLMCCPGTEIVDLPDRTLSIFTDPNADTWNCKRCCSTYVSYACDTTVLWKATTPDSCMAIDTTWHKVEFRERWVRMPWMIDTTYTEGKCDE